MKPKPRGITSSSRLGRATAKPRPAPHAELAAYQEDVHADRGKMEAIRRERGWPDPGLNPSTDLVRNCTDRDRDLTHKSWRMTNAICTREAVETSAANLGDVRFERWMNCKNSRCGRSPADVGHAGAVLPALLLRLWTERPNPKYDQPLAL